MRYELMCYTRKPDQALYYEERLAFSMHLALREGDGPYVPLNHNSGVLFAEATENEDGSLNPKSLRDPVLYRRTDGLFGVRAVRIEGDGDEEAGGATVLHWKSKDLIVYEEVSADEAEQNGASAQAAGCEAERNGVFAETAERGAERDGTFAERVSAEAMTGEGCLCAQIEGCVPGTVVGISEAEAVYLKQKLLTPENVGVTVPEKVCANNAGELSQVTGVLQYSDGTRRACRVDWDCAGIDFSRPGEYRVTGTVHQEHFPFPIAYNRADPCVARWNGKYYFIATNDADDNHTLYIRESDTLAGLVDAEEILLLDSVTYEGIGGLLWAPEFHEINGKLYIFHAATPGEFYCEESHIMELREGGNPACRADWSAPKRILKRDGSYRCEMGKTISLDMTCFPWEGDYYVVWSQRQFLPKDLGAWLYIAKLDPEQPWRLLTDPVVLSKPDFGWANNHVFVDEGPFALIRGERLFLTFSSALVDYTYVVGYLETQKGRDLLDPASWRKNGYPILSARSVPGEYGTGHNAYVEDEDGTIWNTYHARPGAEGVRSSGIRRVHFDVDGCPMLDVTEELDLKRELRQVQTVVSVEGIS